MKQLIWATLVVTIGFSFPVSVLAKDPPAETYQPGFWQPVARVNLKSPLKIQLVNDAGLPLEYDFTTSRDIPPQPIEPQQTVTIQEQIPIPAYLLINPSSSTPTPATGANPNLTFNVSVSQDNVVTVRIIQAGANDQGNTTFNLHETGAIYVY